MYLLVLVGYIVGQDIYMLIYLLSICSIHFWKWGIKVSNLYSRTFFLFNSIEEYS